MTNLALNPFKKGKKTEVEGVRKVEVEVDTNLEKAIKDYIRMKEIESTGEDIITYAGPYRSFVRTRRVLTPKKIYDFLQYLITNDLVQGTENEDLLVTGTYISKLVQNSYNAGYNNFILDTRDIPINVMGSNLKGKKNKSLKLIINGDVGHHSAYSSSYSNISFFGNTGSHLGWHALHSNIKIKGDSKSYCGSYSRSSNFYIEGNGLASLGTHTTKSNFLIDGLISYSPNINMRCGRGSSKSIFSATKYGVFIQLLKEVPVNKNKIQWVYKGGKVRKEVYFP